MIPVKTDSRNVMPGDTFVAIKGISNDGHDFIEMAIKNGATKIIAEHGTYSVETQIVEDSRSFLAEYLKNEYSYLTEKMKLIALTGTNGKTTTAFLIHNAFTSIGIKCAYIGTVGFYIGKKVSNLVNTTPDLLDIYQLLYQAYESGCSYVALETSSQGIAYGRVDGLAFDFAIFTNLTQDHLDFHKTMENYALAKQQLFKQIKKEGKAIINYDDPWKDTFLLPENSNVTYGFMGGDYQVLETHRNHQGTTFVYRENGKEHSISCSLLGDYNIYNLLSAIIVLKECNVTDEQIGIITKEIQAPPGRMEVIKYNDNSIIIDYAHTPDALEKIIYTIKPITKGNIYVAFGCTGDRDRLKRPIMAKFVTDTTTYAIFTSDDLHDEDVSQIMDDMIEGLNNTNYEICPDRRKAIQKGISLLKSNDVFLILGKGHEEVMIVRDKKIPFHDRTVVEETLEEIKKEKAIK